MNGWTAKDMPDQHGRVIVITGANSGVGFESAKALTRRGAHVIMACRSVDKAEKARQELLANIPTASVEVMPLDLGNLQSVHEFAKRFHATHNQLDVLMNNAGIMALPYHTTQDGFEAQFGTNHLGHFALTGLLLPMLLQTPHSRVVTVSSSAYLQGRMNFDNLQGETHYQRWGAYCQSKLANILFTLELQRKLTAAGADVRSMVTHPGHAVTNLQNHGINAWERFTSRMMNGITGQPAEHGATYQLFAATATEAQGGEFYGPKWIFRGRNVRVEPNVRAKNPADAAKLWKISEQLTGVQYELSTKPLTTDTLNHSAIPTLQPSTSGI